MLEIYSAVSLSDYIVPQISEAEVEYTYWKYLLEMCPFWYQQLCHMEVLIKYKLIVGRVFVS